MAISEKRYGDAIYARYHMDGRAKDGVHTDLRDCGEGPFQWHKTSVYEVIMEEARSHAQGCPDLYRDALLFYSSTSPKDTRRDIIEELFQIGEFMNVQITSLDASRPQAATL
ncbi:hypothetical protein N7513_004555 [Penicillium frequentans]|nr:hypothetical protein N7513_004555 [Penicillium glabrum]